MHTYTNTHSFTQLKRDARHRTHTLKRTSTLALKQKLTLMHLTKGTPEENHLSTFTTSTQKCTHALTDSQTSGLLSDTIRTLPHIHAFKCTCSLSHAHTPINTSPKTSEKTPSVFSHKPTHFDARTQACTLSHMYICTLQKRCPSKT